MTKKRILLLLTAILIIIGLTTIIYSPVVNNDFISMDDSYYVTDNDMVKDLSVENFFDFFHTKVAGNIQPLTMLSLSIDYHFWGLDASAYHIHNVILHILNSILVFLFIWFLSERKLFLAFFTSLLFAIHPLHVESVAWISERKDVLYAFYYLAGLIAYLLYKENKKANYLVYTYILFALSLLSKPTAVSFPVVLIVLDYYLEGKFTFKQFYSKTLLFSTSLIFGVINLISQGIMYPGRQGLEVFQKIVFSSYNIVFYIRSFFFPYNVSMFHDTPERIPFFYYISTFLTFLLVVYVLYAIIKKKHKIIIFGVLFFVSTIFLTLHIVAFSRAIVAERYTYIPYIGLAYSFFYIIFYSKNGEFRDIFNKPYLTWGISFVIVISFSIMSFSYIKSAWKNSGTLWTNSIKYCPDSKTSYDARSNYYLLDSMPEVAIHDIRKSLSYKPNDAYANLSLAYYYYYTNNYDSVFLISDKKKNNSIYQGEFTNLRGMTYVKEENYKKALICYDSLLKNKPYNFEYRAERAKINSTLGLFPDAIEDYSILLSLKPKNEENKINIGIAYLNLKRYKKAISNFEEIEDNRFKNFKYYNNLYVCYKLMGDSLKANEVYMQHLKE